MTDFDEVDQWLKEWVGSVLEVPEISLGAPIGRREGRGVNLYLIELKDKPPLRTMKRPPQQLLLRYLVTTWADRPEDAHHLLGQIVFAAMDNPEFEIDLNPVSIDAWRAFDTAPQPSFLLGVTLQRLRIEPKERIVREPLIVKLSPFTSLHGIVLGPGDVPLAEARVEIPGLRLETRTDYQGRFRFSMVPSEPAEKRLEINARGRKLSLTDKENHPGEGDPLVIHFNITED
jgi:hypothetical protein